MGDYWKRIDNAEVTVISCAIDKIEHKQKYVTPENFTGIVGLEGINLCIINLVKSFNIIDFI
jgi:hypothetical protein